VKNLVISSRGPRKLVWSTLSFLFFVVAIWKPAQAQQYWDENSASPPVDLEKGTYSIDQEGQYTTTYVNSLFAGDLTFSADTVTSSSQTILLDGSYNIYVTSGIVVDSAGSITLQDDSSNPGSSLAIAYDGITMDPGAGALTISTPTLYVYGSQTWNNNSSSNLTIAGGVAVGNDQPYDQITLDGSGTGSVIFNDSINVEVGIEQESTTSVLYLNGTKSSNLVNLLINGGIVSAASSTALGPSPVQLEYGGTLIVTATGTFSHPLNVSGGGTLDFTGNTELGWGTNGVVADTLTLGSGDDLDISTGTQSIGTLDLVSPNTTLSTGYRLIVGAGGGGLGLINGTVINVGSGYIFDSGSSGTITNTINFASGSALEIRSLSQQTSAYNTDTYTNAVLPTAGTFTVGSDDYDPGTIILAVPLVLTDTLDLNVNSSSTDGQGTKVTMSGNISGNGGLSITETGSGVTSPLYLSGINTYAGGTTLTNPASGIGLPVVVINGNSSGLGDAFNIQAGTLVVDPAGRGLRRPGRQPRHPHCQPGQRQRRPGLQLRTHAARRAELQQRVGQRQRHPAPSPTRHRSPRRSPLRTRSISTSAPMAPTTAGSSSTAPPPP
jgi:hypothetical protein